MKTKIKTKNFFGISLLTIIFASTSMFGMSPEKPKTYATPLKGDHLKQVKNIRKRITSRDRVTILEKKKNTLVSLATSKDVNDVLNIILKRESIT